MAKPAIREKKAQVLHTPTTHLENRLPAQTHLIVFAVDQGELKTVLCGVDGEDTRPALPVQAVNAVASHARHIDGQVQGPDDAVVTTGNVIMNVMLDPITSVYLTRFLGKTLKASLRKHLQ